MAAFSHQALLIYRLRIFYQTYDVTNLLPEGENQLLATVGKVSTMVTAVTAVLRNMRAKLFLWDAMIVTYTDGSKDELVTDNSCFLLIRAL